jgi:hypothetical protein
VTTRRILVSYSIVDADFNQVGGTDRLSHAEAQRRNGYGVFQYETEFTVTPEGEFGGLVVRQTVYLPPVEKT